MSEIKVGDLVIVKKMPCIGKHGDPHGGWIVQVTGMYTVGWKCHLCGDFATGTQTFELSTPKGPFHRPGWCLKKIPGLGELDGAHAGDKLVEPLKALAAQKHAEQDRRKVTVTK